jgi:hypothetical protein
VLEKKKDVAKTLNQNILFENKILSSKYYHSHLAHPFMKSQIQIDHKTKWFVHCISYTPINIPYIYIYVYI